MVAAMLAATGRMEIHPDQHTEKGLKLIRDMRRRNPMLGMIELWHRLKKRGYPCCPENLFRVMRKMGLFLKEKPSKAYTPKLYEQMTRPPRASDSSADFLRRLTAWYTRHGIRAGLRPNG